MNDGVLSNKDFKEMMALIAVNAIDADDGIETCQDVSNVSDMGKEIQVDEEVNNVLGVVGNTTTLENSGLDTKLVAQVDEAEDVDDRMLPNKNLEKMMALIAVNAMDADDSIELSPNLSNVSDIGKEVQVNEEVNDVLSIVRNTTTFEDSCLDAELVAQVDDAEDVDDRMLSDKNLEKVVALIAVNAMNADDSIELSPDRSNVSDIGKEIQVDEEVNDVLSIVGNTTTLEDGGLNAELVAQVSETEDMDDGMFSDKNLEEIMAFMAVNAVNADNRVETGLDGSNVTNIGEEIQVNEEVNNVLSIVRSTTALNNDSKTQLGTEISNSVDVDNDIRCD
jgi:hypothetical protein